jgi:hypothetical protein
MRNFGAVPIILLILFIVVPIINYILAVKERQRKQRMESRRLATQPPVEMLIQRPAAPKPTVQSASAHPRTYTPPQRGAGPRSGWSRQALFRSRRDLRRTIIAMTILGPCRADDPHD